MNLTHKARINLTRKLIQSHLVSGTLEPGEEIALHIDQTLKFAPKTGDCVTTDLSQVTFSEVTPLKIS